MSKEKSQCKLCLRIAKLCKSHIIPKFAFKECGLIGNRKKFDVPCYNYEGLTQKNKQDGFKEYLLCEVCEQKIAKWEKYAKETVFSKKSEVLFECVSDIGGQLKGLDYKEIKLFTLSLLWRMIVSEKPYFCNVRPNGFHREKLRKMILNDAPGEPWRYGCSFSVLSYQGKRNPFFFSQPRAIHCKKNRLSYRFLFSGHLLSIEVSKTYRMGGFLTEDGTWPIIFSDLTEHKDLVCEVERLKEFQKEQHQKPF